MRSLAIAVGLSLALPAAGMAQSFAERRPDALRDSVGAILGSVTGPDDEGGLAVAEDLARAYAAAWPDSSLLRRVAFVRSLDRNGRTLFAAADSLRRSGNAALYSAGVDASLVAWRAAMALFGSIDDSVGVAATAGNIGAGFYVAGVLDSATIYLERARLLARRSGAPRTAANATTILGNVAYDRGDFGRALELYGNAAEFHGSMGSFEGVAQSLNNRGILAEELGDETLAEAEYSRAIAIATEHGHGVRRADYLLNLGRLRGNAGDYRASADLLEEALAIYRAAGETANEALTRATIGAIRARRSDYPGAIAAYTEAALLYRASEYRLEELAARSDLAVVLAATGRLDSSVAELARTERLARTYGFGPAVLGGIHRARGDVELRLNRIAEARESYREAGRQFSAARDARGAAASRIGLAHADIFAESYRAAAATIEGLLPALNDPRDRAQAWMLLGYARAQSGDPDSALAALREADSTFAQIGDDEGLLLARVETARAELDGGNPLRSEQILRGLLGAATAFPAVEWRVWFALARALEESARATEAVTAYEYAVATIEGAAAGLPGGSIRGLFLADKWEVYERLAVLLSRTGRVEGALAVSETLRFRTMLDIQARGPADRSGAEVAGERELRERVASYSARYTMAAESGRRDNRPAPGLRALADELAGARREYAQFVATLDALTVPPSTPPGRPVTAAEIAGSLRTDDILLEYLMADNEVLIFAVTSDETRVWQVAVPRHELIALVGFARAAIAENPSDGRELWRAPLARLGRLLIDPVIDAGLLNGRARLLVVPHGELHYLPFEALTPGRGPGTRYLIEDIEVSYLPSASLWLRAADRPTPDATGMTVLALAPLADQLPGTAAEVRGIADMPEYRVDAILPPAATEAALRNAVAGHDIVHLATRGTLNPHNPLFSYVSLIPSGDDDGRLEVHEVSRLRLDARLVVLSACETGLGSGRTADVPPGDDWVGLVGSFIDAGAGNVLATLWAVDDVATAHLVRGFYRGVAEGQTYAAALAATKRDFIAEPTTAHPYFWAGFTLTTARSSRAGRM